MKVYLDSCTIQRPLDTFAVLRNKLEAEAVLGIIGACDFVQIDPSVEQRSASFIARGVKTMDAVHVALAEVAAVDYFCSCDDRLLRKLHRMKDLTVTPISPLALIEELEI